MITRWARLRLCTARRSRERGYVAVMTAILLMLFMGICAFAVDVGRWYVVGQQEQRAADAASLAGVTSLPGDQVSAFATAKKFSKINGFEHGVLGTTVATSIDTKPTRLKVTVSRTVSNIFGSLLGVPTTAIGRSSIADYAGPVPLGSPCNEFGDDPYAVADAHKSTNCNGTGAFWANVGSPMASKGSGDAYQNEKATNTDYDLNGYFYAVTVTAPVANLQIEAFDPALIDVGDYCTVNNLAGAETLLPAKTVVSDPATRYADGAGAYCTGDIRYGGTGEVQTQFTVRSPGPNPWDPLSFPIIGGACTQTFAGYTGDMKAVLDKTPTAAYTARQDVAANFRQWKPLCTIANAQPGVYMVQVKTNGVGNDAASGHNRFSLRAFGGTSASNDAVSVAGYNKMAMYANTPAGTSKFFLAKVPSGAKGQLFNVNLWDIGDGAVAGSTVTVLPPVETPGTFSNCTGSGVQSGPLPGCRISVNATFNARWQTISIPIDPAYSCLDLQTTGCWVRLEFFYGAGSNPADTTSWTASIQGDPVRLVQ